jgi:hypothetical protein
MQTFCPQRIRPSPELDSTTSCASIQKIDGKGEVEASIQFNSTVDKPHMNDRIEAKLPRLVPPVKVIDCLSTASTNPIRYAVNNRSMTGD